MNLFVLARLELTSPLAAAQALESLERLVRDGIESGGHRYRFFGARRGRFVTLSLGMPLLGGGAPVLRAWLDEGAGRTRFDVSVGARLELILFSGFWLALTVLGGGYQVFLQLEALAAGRASWGDVLEVLPGIGVMGALLALGLWLFRRRAASHTALLLEAFRDSIGAGTEPAAVPSME